MADDKDDELGRYLADGWDIAGYSVNTLALGSTTQHILLRKGGSLAHCMIMNTGSKEMGRGVTVLTPRPPSTPKKGLWG